MSEPIRPESSPILPFITAILDKNTAQLQALIQGGANVNARGTYDETPLMWAVDEGWLEGIAILLAAGADAKAESEAGVTPLLIATEVWYEGEIVTEVTKRGARVWYNKTQRMITNLLINASASIHDENKHGLAPVFHNAYGTRRIWEIW
jgi:ankyrin repeat protein